MSYRRSEPQGYTGGRRDHNHSHSPPPHSSRREHGSNNTTNDRYRPPPEGESGSGGGRSGSHLMRKRQRSMSPRGGGDRRVVSRDRDRVNRDRERGRTTYGGGSSGRPTNRSRPGDRRGLSYKKTELEERGGGPIVKENLPLSKVIHMETGPIGSIREQHKEKSNGGGNDHLSLVADMMVNNSGDLNPNGDSEDEQIEWDLNNNLEDEDSKTKKLEEERRLRRERLAAVLDKKVEEEKQDQVEREMLEKKLEANEDGYSDEELADIEILKTTDSKGGVGMVEACGSGGGGDEVDVEDKIASVIPSTTNQKKEIANKECQFDMFSSSPSNLPTNPDMMMGGTAAAIPGERGGIPKLLDEGGDDKALQANWTDTEGYYKTRAGEMVEGRYKVLGLIGQGVFSTVLKCLDTQKGGQEVALKVIRNNDTMRKAAQKEVMLLREVAEKDPHNKRHCVLMFENIEHKNHVVMVFESLQMNLRETLKKFGRKVGINSAAVRVYAKQLFIALKHLASLRIIHADIKPDNILVTPGFGCLKLADFGSAFKETDPDAMDVTPYLVSRWYRAPEIALGLPYDRTIDMWSVAVTLFELYTGKAMFPGRNNNEMLWLAMEYKGPFPHRLIKQHLRQFEKVPGLKPHFAEDMRFLRQDTDPVTGATKVRMVAITERTKNIRSVLLAGNSGGDSREMLSSFADLLEKCSALDPRRRIHVSDVLSHPFIKSS